MNYLNDRRLLVDYQQRRLAAAAAWLTRTSRERFIRLTAKLEAMSPLKVLGRGYSMVLSDAGHVVKSAAGLQKGDILTVRLSEGGVTAQVQEVLK